MPNTKHIYNMIELIDKEKIRGRKMSDIKVSIIMPVYKVEEYVGKAIESIQAQTLTEWEFIIVDDGTPDKSGEICDAYAEKDNRIKVIHKVNTGYGHSMNVGLENATGEYVGIIETDDFADLNMFEELYAVTKSQGLYLAAQCCEHLNRALIVEEEAAEKYGLEMVNVVPQLKAGGSFATAAYAGFEHPTAVERIQAHAGIDIGDTFIGMHLRPVAVPVRTSIRAIGGAHVTCARTRLKYIGGERAHYLDAK